MAPPVALTTSVEAGINGTHASVPSSMVAQPVATAQPAKNCSSIIGARIIDRERYSRDACGTCRPRDGDTDEFVVWKSNLARACHILAKLIPTSRYQHHHPKSKRRGLATTACLSTIYLLMMASAMALGRWRFVSTTNTWKLLVGGRNLAT